MHVMELSNLVSAYSPTLYSSEDVKDKLHDQLSKKIQTIPKEKMLLILSDLNTRVGADPE